MGGGSALCDFTVSFEMKRNIVSILPFVTAILSSVMALVTIMVDVSSFMSSPTAEFIAFFAAIVLGFSIIGIYVSAVSKEKRNRSWPLVYVSFPTDLDEETVAAIKESLGGYPVIYSDAVVKPGDDFRKSVNGVLKVVTQYYVIVSGNDLTPRQKYEVKELKKTNVRITPIIDEGSTVPQYVREFEPSSLKSFLSQDKSRIFKLLVSMYNSKESHKKDSRASSVHLSDEQLSLFLDHVEKQSVRYNIGRAAVSGLAFRAKKKAKDQEKQDNDDGSVVPEML